jgi:multidrug resistance efflux pump
MTDLATIPAARRPELLLRPHGNQGQCVVKDPRTSALFHLGEQEYFLLSRLDGTQTDDLIRAAFEARFGEPLSGEDLEEFLQLARSKGLLQVLGGSGSDPGGQVPGTARQGGAGNGPEPQPAPTAGPPSSPQAPRTSSQSLLRYRWSLFDPDRLFTWLAPKLWFIWTWAFVVLSFGAILGAAVVAGLSRQELVNSFVDAMRWETLVAVWFTLLLVTVLHEFAHGLTCKHFGGEVHEVGFMFLFLLPCFYCNVSDAWLLREKSKRLWVTLAGGYCDLCVWALAVFAWRLTIPNSLLNYLAWVVLSVLGARVFCNFNPLLKLDGYYLLTDLLEIPNLQQRAREHLTGVLRQLLWGAPRPEAGRRGPVLLAYGLLSWLFALGFLGIMLATLLQFLEERWGLVGILVTSALGAVVARSLLRGLVAGEMSEMLAGRPRRTALWLLSLGAAAAVLLLGRMEDRAGGAFQVRAVVLAELRAPVSGFLREAYVTEGDRVSPSERVLLLEIPNLTSRLAQKRAEVREMRAKLRLLKVGPRPEEVLAQRRRVERAQLWRDNAEQDLTRARQAFRAEVDELDRLIAQQRAECNYAEAADGRARRLVSRGALSVEAYQGQRKNREVAQAEVERAEAKKRARLARGTREAETELARREKELAEAEAALTLLEAGTRPEDVEAGEARLARLQEEARSLEGLQEKQLVPSPVQGLLTTPRLQDKIGQYFREGELICLIEEPGRLEAEILLPNEDVSHVRPGQRVELRARTEPFQAFKSEVDRIAPRAVPGDEKRNSAVTAYCRVGNPSGNLRPGMIGYARIYCDRRRVGQILLERALRFLRTEFW